MDDSRLTERKINSKLAYSGAVFDVYSDRVLLSNGKETGREYVGHHGAVAVVPLTDDGKVIMERQFRYAHNSVIYEIPAGKLEKTDSDPLFAAKRELREETGVTAAHFVSLGRYIGSPAILSEVIYVYLATGLTYGETDPDEDEFLDVCEMPLDCLTDMIMNNEIPDGKTVFGLLKTRLYLERGGMV